MTSLFIVQGQIGGQLIHVIYQNQNTIDISGMHVTTYPIYNFKQYNIDCFVTKLKVIECHIAFYGKIMKDNPLTGQCRCILEC